MGIQITKTHERYGIDLDYWKVGEVKVNWHQKTCRVRLMGFVNQAQRDAGKDAVMEHNFSFEGASFVFTHDSGLIGQIYAKIKMDTGWEAGIDVLED